MVSHLSFWYISQTFYVKAEGRTQPGRGREHRAASQGPRFFLGNCFLIFQLKLCKFSQTLQRECKENEILPIGLQKKKKIKENRLLALMSQSKFLMKIVNKYLMESLYITIRRGTGKNFSLVCAFQAKMSLWESFLNYRNYNKPSPGSQNLAVCFIYSLYATNSSLATIGNTYCRKNYPPVPLLEWDVTSYFQGSVFFVFFNVCIPSSAKSWSKNGHSFFVS